MKTTNCNEIVCLQLHNEMKLDLDRYIEISKLVYDTDPYIYPAMFGTGEIGEKKAISVLSSLYKSGTDTMFCLNKLFVSMINDKITGLILWNKGILNWDYGELLDEAQNLDIIIMLSDLEKAKNEYFSKKYDNCALNDNRISIINMCIDKTCRNMGIGNKLLRAFLDYYDSYTIDLCVLADNLSAVNLYKKYGFKITGEFYGFSLDDNKPNCYDMVLER